MPKAEDHSLERRRIGDVEVTVTVYKIGDLFHCHVANVDPGAVIARASAQSREEAEAAALRKAEARV